MCVCVCLCLPLSLALCLDTTDKYVEYIFNVKHTITNSSDTKRFLKQNRKENRPDGNCWCCSDSFGSLGKQNGRRALWLASQLLGASTSCLKVNPAAFTELSCQPPELHGWLPGSGALCASCLSGGFTQLSSQVLKFGTDGLNINQYSVVPT